MKQNDFFDLLKLILALMVVAIHTGLCIPANVYKGNLLWPWLRIAVPLFFLMSSYFLFSKLAVAEDKSSVIKGYVKRNAQLYLFWFVVLLPITLFIRRVNWFGNDTLVNILHFTRSVVFGSTFVASWFITAMVIAVVIVYWLSKMSHTLTVLVSICCFLLAAASSAYYLILPSFHTYINWARCILGSPENSFTAAMFWVYMGKLIAEKKFDISKCLSIVILITSIVLFYFEWHTICSISDCYRYDVYLSLTPLCLSLFMVLKRVKMSIPDARFLRRLSIALFVIHGSIIWIVYGCLHKIIGIEDDHRYVTFCCTVLMCFVWCLLQKRYESVKGFQWLRFAR